MKTLILSLTSAAAVSAALCISGHNLDAPSILGICFCAGFLGLFAKDYSRNPKIDLSPVQIPAAAKPARARARREAPVYQPANFIIFNTTAA
jgi:hypothetical protein